ncbi:MAG: signal recognition particle receptor subunit alpha, partial [Lactobacillus crispatus]|nr:signal recognition particle receptor subunit alpha [Lactobacillus crispatus]
MGLFDRIKKSLFGKKDEEDENKKEEKQTEQENEAKTESEDNDQESEKVVDEAKSKTETTDEEEQTVEAQEDSEVEAESGDEEKAVDLDSKQQPEEVKVEETTETETEEQVEETEVSDEEPTESQEQLYEKGLEKTNKGFGARLNAFFAKFRTVDEDFFDDLEDLLIESDVGYETAEQLTNELREEAKLQNAKSRDDLKRVIVEKLVDLYDKGGNSEDEQLTYNAEAKPNVYLLVGVNGAGKTTTIGKLAKRFKDEG